VPLGSTGVQPPFKLDAANSSLNPTLAEANPTLKARVKNPTNSMATTVSVRFLVKTFSPLSFLNPKVARSLNLSFMFHLFEISEKIVANP
jgi:hypothetical protein